MKTKKRCQRCKSTTKRLMVNSKRKRADNAVVYNYICNDCANSRRKLWYNSSIEKRHRQYYLTMKSYAKLLGYKLTKI